MKVKNKLILIFVVVFFVFCTSCSKTENNLNVETQEVLNSKEAHIKNELKKYSNNNLEDLVSLHGDPVWEYAFFKSNNRTFIPLEQDGVINTIIVYKMNQEQSTLSYTLVNEESIAESPETLDKYKNMMLFNVLNKRGATVNADILKTAKLVEVNGVKLSETEQPNITKESKTALESKSSSYNIVRYDLTIDLTKFYVFYRSYACVFPTGEQFEKFIMTNLTSYLSYERMANPYIPVMTNDVFYSVDRIAIGVSFECDEYLNISEAQLTNFFGKLVDEYVRLMRLYPFDYCSNPPIGYNDTVYFTFTKLGYNACDSYPDYGGGYSFQFLENCEQKIAWLKDMDDDGYYDANSAIQECPDWTPYTGYKKASDLLGPDCDDNNSKVQKLNSCKKCAPEPASGKCPCFGATSDIDTSNLFDSKSIETALKNAGLGNLSSSLIEFFKSSGLIDASELSGTGNKILQGKAVFGKAIGVGNIIFSAKKYIEAPTTQNLLRLAYDSTTSNPATAANVGLISALAELYRFENGESIIDKILGLAADELEKLIDCDLGAGVHGLVF